ncbi:DUF2516 family protein [Georgenia alba]|uniref:DUF2516 family protein n=1 Tax=Georgenia alba TaxID=2233858 RepID=A0ABW2QC98_9MICO
MLGSFQMYLFLALSLVLLGVEVWALVDLLRRPASAFVAADKRTKKFWGLVLGGAAAIGFVTIPPPLGIGILGSSFLQFVAVVPAGIYLADVRPAVEPYSRRRPPSGGGRW